MAYNSGRESARKMLVMIANVGFDAGRIYGTYPDRVAHLHNVTCMKEPKHYIPWALDNGVYGAWQNCLEWDEEPFYKALDRFADYKPMWVVVPDWVGDRERTLELWEKHSRAVSAFGVNLAFAAQDGMTVNDVPKKADVVFVGGTTSWKWRNLRMWTENFPRVHVGRVNSRRLLECCEEAGAESCDGTGWFRDPHRTEELEKYFKAPKNQPELI